MTEKTLANKYQETALAAAKRLQQPSIQHAQEALYKVFITSVKKYSPETVLSEFRQLFSLGDLSLVSKINQDLSEIILHNDEELFRNTIKRICYILVNNWVSRRKYQYIQKLIQTLAEAAAHKNVLSQNLQNLRKWLDNFINSDDYQELKLYASLHVSQERDNWSHRYSYFLLASQSLDSSNPIEQREIAKNISTQLKETFNFELAMYTVRCDSPNGKAEKNTNPTRIENGVELLIKKIISKRLLFSYAHRLNKQIGCLDYLSFKQSLKDYFLFDVEHEQFKEVLKNKLVEKIDLLYKDYEQETISFGLLLRTGRRLIEFLTTEDGHEPSLLFILLINQENPLDLVIVLLKIILVCKYVRSHLEICLAKLISYYENSPERECKWFIDFLETFNVVFAIYTENVRYDLVKVKDSQPDHQNVIDLDVYRIFPQSKGADLREAQLRGADLHSNNLSDSDLRGVDLSGTNLTQADLSLAKLSKANLRGANLQGAELIVADLSGACLNGANLKGSDLRRANLRQADLQDTNLQGAKLQKADLEQADLDRANLCCASVNHSNLKEASLSLADLQQVSLKQSNLTRADLRDANLTGANLCSTQLDAANLSGVNLDSANLSGAKLRGANLNKTNLHCATLHNANLANANLTNACLSRANLSNANLARANLSFALVRHTNLSGADLRDVNLIGANLFGTDLKQANVQGARFGRNSGLSEEIKIDLKQRGAIF
ncbi:MAG: pentapeptide repeat-containing protein [Coleofasciculaceae cyanobacterium]